MSPKEALAESAVAYVKEGGNATVYFGPHLLTIVSEARIVDGALTGQDSDENKISIIVAEIAAIKLFEDWAVSMGLSD